MTDEEREAEKRKNYFARQAYIARHGRRKPKTEEEKQKQIERHRNWRNKLDAEGRKRYNKMIMSYNLKHMAKMKAEDPEKWRKYLDYVKEYQRRRYARETEEERKKRRFKDRVNAAKRRLKRQLEEQGLEQEEIEERLKKRHEEMWLEFDPNWVWPAKVPRGRRPNIRITDVKTVTTVAAPLPVQMQANNSKDNHQDLISEKQEEFNEEEMKMSSSGAPSPDNSNDWQEVEYNVVPVYEDSMPVPEPVGTVFEVSSLPPPPVCLPEPVNLIGLALVAASASSCDIPPTTPIPPPMPLPCQPISLNCIHCGLLLPDRKQLVQHIRSKHFLICWKCPQCYEVMISSEELAAHFQTQHQPKPNPVDAATVKVRKPRSSVVKSKPKLSVKQRDLEFLCMKCLPLRKNGRNKKQCSFSFKSREKLLAHVEATHFINYWPCEHCGLLKYRKTALQFHRKFCGGEQTESGANLGKRKTGRGKKLQRQF